MTATATALRAPPAAARNVAIDIRGVSHAFELDGSRLPVLESIDLMLQKRPIDDVGWLMNPRWYNIAWMSVLEEVHGSQRGFASIY